LRFAGTITARCLCACETAVAAGVDSRKKARRQAPAGISYARVAAGGPLHDRNGCPLRSSTAWMVDAIVGGSRAAESQRLRLESGQARRLPYATTVRRGRS